MRGFKLKKELWEEMDHAEANRDPWAGYIQEPTRLQSFLADGDEILQWDIHKWLGWNRRAEEEEVARNAMPKPKRHCKSYLQMQKVSPLSTHQTRDFDYEQFYKHKYQVLAYAYLHRRRLSVRRAELSFLAEITRLEEQSRMEEALMAEEARLAEEEALIEEQALEGEALTWKRHAWRRKPRMKKPVLLRRLPNARLAEKARVAETRMMGARMAEVRNAEARMARESLYD